MKIFCVDIDTLFEGKEVSSTWGDWMTFEELNDKLISMKGVIEGYPAKYLTGGALELIIDIMLPFEIASCFHMVLNCF